MAGHAVAGLVTGGAADRCSCTQVLPPAMHQALASVSYIIGIERSAAVSARSKAARQGLRQKSRWAVQRNGIA